MHITATQIADWAKTKEAQVSLPRLVRKLVQIAETPTQVTFPAGDSTGLPGWDGELVSERGSSWVPKGKSFWELSCEGGTTRKANRDYSKRTMQTPAKIRAAAVLVVVSARRWTRKAEWLKAKRRTKKWADVRAYDADDLDQWLEQAPAVALQFAEELGLIGPGVESVSKYWGDWSQQSRPVITNEAFFIDRQKARDRFLADMQQRIESGRPEPYTIRADSVDEAAAFACAAFLTHPQLGVTSLVVTHANGWRYVEQNPAIKVALAARPECAERPTRRNGLVVVIPYEAGNMSRYYRGVAGRDSNADLTIERPRIYEFEKALTSIGLDEADSKRLAVSTGRSWSVFRRRLATNPAIQKPMWLDVPQATALPSLCLLGGWSAEKPADRDIVAQLAGRSYEDIERDLRHLAQLDDAPILQIGEVWKARSPLELLDLFGHRITRDELERFFQIVQSILVIPDPQLDLPDEERHAAQIYGKVRPQSGLLIEALCDTLIKLAVRGPQVPALASANIEGRISTLVESLLHDADGTRWLSLSSLLPDLAEAAPDAFMKAIEVSLLAKPDKPVTRLLTETSGSGLLGRCWHSGLLWALERLAWVPERLARVSLILARLSTVSIKGNWANSPKASLVDIFRSWYPQTAANLDQRIEVLHTLIAKEPDAAFDLLDALVNMGPDSASPSARPSWRDDDAGAGHGVTEHERREMLVAAADLMIACSEGNPQRIASLIEKISTFDAPRVNSTLALADQFAKSSVLDEDREIIRTALRTHIHWHRNYDKVRGKALDESLQPLEDLYGRLLPHDFVVRHRWLFTGGWPNLPALVREAGYEKRGELVETWRINALRELYSEHGMSGISKLAASCAPQSYYVGLALAKLDLDVAQLSEWIEKDGTFTPREPLTMAISGLLHALANPGSTELINMVLENGRKLGWDAPKMARFLILAREERTTWSIAAACGTEIENAYWSMLPAFWLRSDDADLEFALRRLLTASRPRSALHVCHFDVEKVDAKLLAEILELTLKGEEPDGPRVDSYHLGEAIERLESSGAIEIDQLIRLEFALIPALGYEGEQHARSLYNAIMSDSKLFTEVLSILYKPANTKREDSPTEAEQAAARTAWRVLHECKRQPGTQPDGTVDRDKLVKFVDEARDLCRAADRLAVCDSTIGQILAYGPVGTDGVWPFESARELLDRPELDGIRRGFQIGAFNKRGVTSRNPDDGGGQERALAEEYRRHARALQNSHPHIAAALEEIAHSYENHGLREDLEAQLRREGY